ncbi:PRP3, partial [Cervus elaphus hippelaphus]
MAHVFILAGSCLLLLLVLSNLLLCQGNVCPSCGPDVFGIPLNFLRNTFSRNEDLTKWILMLQYLWTAPLVDLGTDHRIEKDLSDTIISSALENIKKCVKLQVIFERRFSQ